MSDLDLREIERFCTDLAGGAKNISLKYFRKRIEYEQKEDLSPVTIADQAIEAYARQRIAATYPDHGIIGEEMEAIEQGRYIWYIDPIDGTKSFISGMPFFGMLAALRDAQEERILFGMIDIPALGERWMGTGRSATFNGAPCRVSGCTRLNEAQLYTTSPDIFTKDDWETYERISHAARFRRFGGDCYLYGLLASGHCDLVIEASLKTFDFMALIPVVEGAGGVVTDWDGRPVTPMSDGRVVAAASQALLDEVLSVIHSSERSLAK